ncbi:hypothetical protein K5E_23940 [Enterococcus thailandicus]|nr:hypothetical protein K4E_24490 [Enterococcus thailandicus]GMC10255.1 hypothetical protein K5E_23940 [Enterococcus thailandicus]
MDRDFVSSTRDRVRQENYFERFLDVVFRLAGDKIVITKKRHMKDERVYADDGSV